MSVNNRNWNFLYEQKEWIRFRKKFLRMYISRRQGSGQVNYSSGCTNEHKKKYEIDNEHWNDRLSTKELTVTRIKSNAIVGIMVNCCSTTDRLRIQK